MFSSQIPIINEQIKKNNKVIISIGCSFVQAQGAIDDDLFDSHEWEYLGMGHPLKIKIDKRTEFDLVNRYPELKYHQDFGLDFSLMELKNSFVSVLCNKYFQGAYTPINLGQKGCGNRASIKELYFWPQIDWGNVHEIIVVYVPSGLERFDFVNDLWPDHFHWKAMWPNEVENPTNGREHLWNGYNRSLYSEKFAIIEQISHIQELLTWCKSKNARLIVTPGFDRRYDREFFEAELSKTITRDINGKVQENKFLGMFSNNESKEHLYLADLWPWDSMFKPNGAKTFADMAMDQEPNLPDRNDFFFQFLGNRSPNGWMTACAHPGAKAHDLFAKLLFEKLKL